MKRVLSVVLAVIMVFAIVAIPASAHVNVYKPTAPNKAQVHQAIGYNYYVSIYCVDENRGTYVYPYTGVGEWTYYGVDVGEVTGDATTGYFCKLTFDAQKYCTYYNTLSRTQYHELAAGQETAPSITLKWNAATYSWCAVDNRPIVIKVVHAGYEITFNAGDHGTIGGEKTVVNSVKPGNAITAPEATGDAGWYFAGWKNEAGVTVLFPFAAYRNATYTAQWAKTIVTVNFDANFEGASVVSPKHLRYGDEIGEMPTVSRPGYVFDGWFTDAEEGEKVDTTYVVNADQTLYAHWSVAPTPITYYTLSYESNGGTVYSAENYASGTNVALNKIPNRAGYTFTGWYSDKELSNKITSIVMSKHTTVYAGWEKTPTPSILNSEDHFAYIIGYGDMTVLPEQYVTRAEVCASIFRLLRDEVREQYLCNENLFKDVEAGSWFNTVISTIAKLGLINGYEDGSFKPNAYITRAEFAVIAAKIDGLTDKTESEFTDISGHWAAKFIGIATNKGWMIGYSDRTFCPNQFITRAEFMAACNRVLNRMPEADDILTGTIAWTDVDVSKWYYIDVTEATNSHNYTRDAENGEKWNELLDNRNWLVYHS